MTDMESRTNLEPLDIVNEHDQDSQNKNQNDEIGEGKKNAVQKQKFDVDGCLMKFKGEPNEDRPEMTLMIGPASSIASTESLSISNAQRMAEDLGFQTKMNKEYLLVEVNRKPNHFNHLALKIQNLKGMKVVVKSVDVGSYVSDIIQIGDHILAISGQKVIDKTQCKDLILKQNGDFEALIERNRQMPELQHRSVDSFVCTQFVPMTYSYTAPNPKNCDHILGNPLDGYENPPEDVKKMAHEYVAFLKCPMDEVHCVSPMMPKEHDSRVSFDKDVLVEIIHSDVDPNRVLKISPRNACLH